MKKFQWLSCCIFSLFLLYGTSCQNDKVDPHSNLSSSTDLPLLAKLKEAGFKENQIEDQGEYYLVSGDLLFKKNETDLKQVEAYFALKKGFNQGKSAREQQWQTPGIISSFNVENIKVYVNPSIKANYEVALQEAIGNWARDANSKINFAFIDTDQPTDNSIYADVNVYADNSITGDYARAEFPSTNKPGWRIRVNTSLSNGLSYLQKRFLFAHEMGHVLGLYHTDEYHPGYLIPGTPQSDPNSVMNSGVYYNGVVPPWNSFSTYDKIAVQYLYPWGTYDKWLTSPEGKYTGLYGYGIFGGDRYDQSYASFDITWNNALVTTSTVTLQLYEKGALKGTLASNIPNTGYYHVNNTPLLPTNMTPAYTPLIQIKIISDANPAISDFSSTFYVGFNGD
ncbi:M57 family metalloprotease [Xanthocytophaga agilis]|uniref:M57 family metalloprotease n=1 Tax=Xanthocytophaga agilis TaxID=3048010 RepID=A0AAE3UFL3_9BACT|nr:M57 family metalloprotease [Xanthocytophaga agilis]MDJ1503385.1 M57 family metalloprotease [Xanthocytophaga agilis]